VADVRALLPAAVDEIYHLSGLGSLMLAALGTTSGTYDLPTMAVLFFIIAAFAILVTFVIDILYTWSTRASARLRTGATGQDAHR
jgi:ABC-type dipeptide/oligopeptide/nickel transport system permease component